MAPVTNGSIIFNEVPEGFPIIDKTVVYKAGTIDLENVPLNGGVLAKTLYLSIDGHMRLLMMKSRADAGGVPIYQLGKPIWGFGLASVLRSEREGVREGDVLFIYDCPFQEYNVLSAEHMARVIKKEPGVPLSAHLSVLGMPARTAFYGLELIGKPKSGETIYISTGAGAVGSVVAQLAKAKGLKVIASAGSDDKVDFMKGIGVDVAFNYKVNKVADVLAKEGPIDIYWDNLGGPTLEAALDACNHFARVVLCGGLSNYNAAGGGYPIKNTSHILLKRLRVQGFMNWEAEAEVEGQVNNPVKFLNAFVPLIKSGELKWSEQVFEGIKSAGEANLAVQAGTSTAKVVIKVADP